MTPLQEKLVRIALEVNAKASLKEAADLDRKFKDVGIDSLEAMSVILAATEQFGLTIPDEEVDGITTLNELARLIEERQ